MMFSSRRVSSSLVAREGSAASIFSNSLPLFPLLFLSVFSHLSTQTDRDPPSSEFSRLKCRDGAVSTEFSTCVGRAISAAGFGVISLCPLASEGQLSFSGETRVVAM
jgi:hypothetical protein